MEKIAVVYILDKQDNILALKRAPHKKIHANMWHVLSGRIEKGETPQSCIEREIAEELGSNIQVGLVQQSHYIDTQTDGQWDTTLFIYRYEGGDIILNNENTEYGWFSKEELLNLDCITSLQADMQHLDFFKEMD